MGDVHTIRDGDIVRYDTRGGVSMCRVVVNDNGDAIGALVPIVMCEACGENDAGDYEIGGHNICPRCVNEALAFLVVYDVVNNIGDYNVPLARTVSILDEEDARMRNVPMSHVDAHSAAWDMIRGEDRKGAESYVYDIARVIVDATRNPGDVL